ncbi:MAG TPA: FliA/WhiG family RNA polymerase sigma factor [Candidatus Baltobacteraceae bacterium]|nr:FliA/WhiG family RNA polymerase sigma factor [Candidatus Baltobacteraceae bacterium]
MSEDLRPLWRRFRVSRDPELRDRLIRETVGLVRKVAGRLALRLPPHVELDDLESAGIPGLLAAVEAYDPDKDVDFATYAQVRIRGAILDELRLLDPLPRSLRDKARQIERTSARLEQEFLRAATDQEIADALGMPLESYHRVLYELRGGLHLSLDSASGGEDLEDGGEPPPITDERAADPWQAMALKERKALLGSIIDQLPSNERTVLSLYYYEELTMKEIAAVLEVSESRVSQIHSAALLRIRGRLRQRRLQPDDLSVRQASTQDPRRLAHAVR